jgi:hypothetical protein
MSLAGGEVTDDGSFLSPPSFFPIVVTPIKNGSPGLSVTTSTSETESDGQLSQVTSRFDCGNDERYLDDITKQTLLRSSQKNSERSDSSPSYGEFIPEELVKSTNSDMEPIKPIDKPRRPLSAYNIFFQLQRDRILNDESYSPDSPIAFKDSDCERIVSNISRQRIVSSNSGRSSSGSCCVKT